MIKWLGRWVVILSFVLAGFMSCLAYHLSSSARYIDLLRQNAQGPALQAAMGAEQASRAGVTWLAFIVLAVHLALVVTWMMVHAVAAGGEDSQS